MVALNAWLTDKGQIIEVDDSMHDEYAYDLIDREVGFKSDKILKLMDEKGFSTYGEFLFDRGWVKVRTNYDNTLSIVGDEVDTERLMRNTRKPAMNPTQMRVAKKICNQKGTSLHKALNVPKFW